MGPVLLISENFSMKLTSPLLARAARWPPTTTCSWCLTWATLQWLTEFCFQVLPSGEMINAPETLWWQVISPNTIFRHVLIISMHNWNSAQDFDKSHFEDRHDHLQRIMWEQNDIIESCWGCHYKSTELKMSVLAFLVMNSWPLLFQNLLKKTCLPYDNDNLAPFSSDKIRARLA